MTVLPSDWLKSVNVFSGLNTKLPVFNVSKCCLLHFPNNCTSPVNCTYELDNALIAYQKSWKDFGVIFSSDLSWSQHYQEITFRAYRQLCLIRRCFSTLSGKSEKGTLHSFNKITFNIYKDCEIQTCREWIHLSSWCLCGLWRLRTTGVYGYPPKLYHRVCGLVVKKESASFCHKILHGGILCAPQ